MTRFILIKRKGAKRWLGAIPIKKGARLASVRATLRRGLKKGFTSRIVSKEQLKRVIVSLRPR